MSTDLPKGLTRGYAKSFTDMIVGAAMKVLTIKELETLDELDCYREIARTELENRIESDDGTP